MSQTAPPNRIMARMLERLFAAILSGPSMNCRPHNSRQRVDWTQLAALQDVDPSAAFQALLADVATAELAARVPVPPRDEQDPNFEAATTAWTAQQGLLTKLRRIVDEARTYQNDTGAYVLNLGFPLLSIPPGAVSAGSSRRLLAPIAFIPVTLQVGGSATPKISISCKEADVDRVTPNASLFAWLAQQTGQSDVEALIEDAGLSPLQEISDLVRVVCTALEIAAPDWTAPPSGAPRIAADAAAPDAASDDTLEAAEPDAVESAPRAAADAPDALARLTLVACPRADGLGEKPQIISAAVLGLFPLSNQGLIRDTRAMIAGEALEGPVRPFLDVAARLDEPATLIDAPRPDEARLPAKPRFFDDERFVTRADPCQAQAVRAARECAGLVLHGPPGTGKSQTITNVIGDHLARGERVLFVCDKRTALDVVANRLTAVGLGDLCALIHDPQRDQKDLYRTLREQLELLSGRATDARAAEKLKKLDAELSKLYADLKATYADLHAADDGGPSFHHLVGAWMELESSAETTAGPTEAFEAVTLRELDDRTLDLTDLFERAQRVQWSTNPWRGALGVSLEAFLRRPAAESRQSIASLVAVAEAADATLHPQIPPFGATALADQSAARLKLAEALERLRREVPALVRARWENADTATLRAAWQQAESAWPQAELLRAGKADAELDQLAPADVSAARLAQKLLALDEYLQIARRWYALLQFGRKKRAREVLAEFGLALSPQNAERLQTWLSQQRARLQVRSLCNEWAGGAYPAPLDGDAALVAAFHHLHAFLTTLHRVGAAPELANCSAAAREALAAATSADRAAELATGLRASAPRATAIVELVDAASATGLFDDEWTQRVDHELRGGAAVAARIGDLQRRYDEIEDMLRIAAQLQQFSAALRPAVALVLERGLPPAEASAALRRGALRREIDRRLQDNVRLPTLDGHRIETMIARFQTLEERKRDLVRDAILHQWVSKQKERLLAGTGSRLNSLGADLKRRLLLRGKNALRLRQVIALGARYTEGDPLFDLAPVWLASPETVAQVFPRLPLFDSVMFDEASQVRLEEALPLLTRGRRVFIAGDPKQLPPTRFFESTVASSDEVEIENEQDLFEVQQSSVEDLLDAALNLDIPQCYLDVHYRSKAPELIDFSNKHFYSGRLQALPGHPDRLPQSPPVRLIRADGVYENRQNPREAERVVELVRELLVGKKPPSIGVACFNLSQRDLIAEQLDAAAAEDPKFADLLAAARSRVDDGEYRGLFVKNLENVQGDERDHIIISTTYGPDAQGRFYRRFGPLGQPGGGRRLNVLVTRAKNQVHVVTSIPRAAYATLPPAPAGQVPSGGWLLFAYLQFAEQDTETFQKREQEGPLALAALESGQVRATSQFAASIAQCLAANGRAATAHWGNDGFCVDVVTRGGGGDGASPETVGWLTDFNRYGASDDPIDWEIYRTGMLTTLGWKLRRVWTPTFVRDPAAILRT